MALVKRTRNGKGVLFVDDEGRVYSTSVFGLRGVIDQGKAQVLTRLPFNTDVANVPVSPLYVPPGAPSVNVDLFKPKGKGESVLPVRDIESW